MAIARLGRHVVPACAVALVLRLGWPTTLGDADRDRWLRERMVPASQEVTRLECQGLGVAETVAARILGALGRPATCAPGALAAPGRDGAD